MMHTITKPTCVDTIYEVCGERGEATGGIERLSFGSCRKRGTKTPKLKRIPGILRSLKFSTNIHDTDVKMPFAIVNS